MPDTEISKTNNRASHCAENVAGKKAPAVKKKAKRDNVKKRRNKPGTVALRCVSSHLLTQFCMLLRSWHCCHCNAVRVVVTLMCVGMGHAVGSHALGGVTLSA